MHKNVYILCALKCKTYNYAQHLVKKKVWFAEWNLSKIIIRRNNIWDFYSIHIPRYPPHSIMNFRILFTRVFLRTFILPICIALQFTDLLKNVIFANNQEACIAAEGLLKEFYPLRVFPAAFSRYSLGVVVCIYTLPWLAGAESSSNNHNRQGPRLPPPRPRAARAEAAAAAGSYI